MFIVICFVKAKKSIAFAKNFSSIKVFSKGKSYSFWGKTKRKSIISREVSQNCKELQIVYKKRKE